MDEKKLTTSSSEPVFEKEVSLLEEINRQAEAELTPKLNQRKFEGLFISSGTLSTSIKDSCSPTESSDAQSSIKSESNDLESTLTDNLFTNSQKSTTSSVFTSEQAPNSSHLGLLLLSNAKRKLELEEERLEFEKEKKREKEKRKNKKLFYKLSKRIKEKSSSTTMPTIISTSISDGAIKNQIEDDENSTVYSSTFDKCNESTDSGLIPSSAEERDETIEEKVKRLEKELKEAKRNAYEANLECEKLKKMQKSLDHEVQDLTETLFQEAYKLANAAEARKEHAEKLLNEALMKVDLLQAEVKALKEIVKSPNKRILRDKTSKSHSILTTKSKNNKLESPKTPESLINDEDYKKIDSIFFEEFKEWRISEKKLESKFIQRLLKEDVEPCLSFPNKELSSEILESIKMNKLEMEPHFDSETMKECALSKIKGTCPYRLKTDNDKEWAYVSLFSRNRITAVCDIYTYLRYLENGIISPTDEDSFLSITVMRKNLALARFGFQFTAKMNGSGLTDKD